MKRVLITGAGSYVGTAVRKRLEREPHRFQVEELDVRDSAWREFSFGSYDAIFHVAGIAHVTADPSMEDLYMSVNRDLAIEVAGKAKAEGVGQFIFMSSIIVYGSRVTPKDAARITMETEPLPKDFYGRSKLEAENGLRALCDGDSFKVAILRCPMIYGPGCTRGNFPKLVAFARKLPVFPDYDNRRSMLYLGNLSEFVAEVAERDLGGLFFPQNSEYTQTSSMVSLVANANGKKIRLLKVLNPAIEVLLAMGNAAAVKAFGSLYYDQACSDYGFEYRPYDLASSIDEIAVQDGWAK